ncbi:MAG: S41 family peptidase [Gemmatimonadales bacterium]
MRHRKTALGAVVIFLAFVSGGWFLQRSPEPEQDARAKARIFRQVMSYVSDYYVDTLETGDLYDMAIEGLLDRINDPYTSYLHKEAFEDLNLSTTGNYGGVGIQIDSRDGWITVVTPLANTPGERAGLESGDQIIEIDGKSTEGWTTRQAANVMRGVAGTEVHLSVMRPGLPGPIPFNITRARIHVNYVETPMMLAPSVGYVRITSVSQTAGKELEQAIKQLHNDGARSLILDLRGNPGGILEQGVAIADLFIDRGDVVVEMKGRAPRASQIYLSQHEQSWPDMPMVVLVNQGTASAAEIIAGALQDHDRALILGTRTYGKGVAYVVLPLSTTKREALSVTTSRWYTPRGRSINRPLFRKLTQRQAKALRDSAIADSGVTFLSDAGRTLKGGGGIRPDIELLDTLSTSEQAFARALGTNTQKYRDAVSRFALDLKGSQKIAEEDFTVTPTMLRELRLSLRGRGVPVPDSIWAGASRLIARQLGVETTRYVFGRPAERRRQARSDIQIKRAIDLLTHAKTQSEVFAKLNDQ